MVKLWFVLLGLNVGICLPLVSSAAASSGTDGDGRGQIVGAQLSTHPDWFLESFLEIADDAAKAAAEGKHLILFFDSEGCPYCYKMIEESFKQPPNGDFVRASFDTIALNIRGSREVAFTEKLRFSEKDLARHIGLRFTPTMLFLDGNSKVVLRVDGYRSVRDFGYLLSYVNDKAYLKTRLADYLEDQTAPSVYSLRPHPSFESISDLSTVRNKPLMVIFEDESCEGCDALHDNILSLDATKALLEDLTVVRFDARSTAPIVDPEGNATTPAQWANQLELNYRPGVVMFDEGKEVFRIDALRYRFHFQQSLKYVGERQWRNYARYQDFARAHRESILASGEDVYVVE